MLNNPVKRAMVGEFFLQVIHFVTGVLENGQNILHTTVFASRIFFEPILKIVYSAHVLCAQSRLLHKLSKACLNKISIKTILTKISFFFLLLCW